MDRRHAGQPRTTHPRRQVTSTWWDPRTSRVYIGVTDRSVFAVDTIDQIFGGRVDVRQEDMMQARACVSRTNCGDPMKGGLWITSTNNWSCTSAFNGRDSFSGRYLLTAGHCIVDAGIGTYWTHNGSSFGQGVNQTFYNGTRADAGLIAHAGGGDRNLIYASGPTDVRHMTSGAGNGAQSVGGGVCRSDGRNNLYTCGTITKADYTVTVSGNLMYHQWEASFGTAYGGSGAPMMYNYTIYGIFSASTATRSTYSTLDGIWYELGVRPCLDAACYN